VIGSPGYPRDEEWIGEVARRSFDRGHDPDGVRRQFAAIIAAPDRRPVLRRLRMPALVVHGEADPLVQSSGGRATARVIPGARLVLYPGMGHDLPAALQPAVVEQIVQVTGLWSPAA
jgi:pimeloyl-ACP methyl ester carboxylesterase